MAAPMYSDLNLAPAAESSRHGDFQSSLPLNVIDTALTLGYERIALNNIVECAQGGKGKKHKEKMNILPPSEMRLNEETLKALKARCSSFEQLTRLTAVLQDAANLHKLSSPEVQAYDIVAVQPTSEKTFQMACTTLDVDVISLNLSENLGFSLRRPMLGVAAERGIHFEICYSHALRDNTVKRNILSNAMTLITAGRGKNIIISSGAQEALDVRSPHDVINLASFLGLNSSQAKDAICRNCRAVLKHAESRRTCKSVISVSTVSSLSMKDKRFVSMQEKAFFEAEGKISEVAGPVKENNSDDSDNCDDLRKEPPTKRLKT